jgi:hypothetical protein
MAQNIRIPVMKKGATGVGEFAGAFELGEGSYHVDWLMRDNSGRVCASFWDLDAKLEAKDEPLREWIHPAVVEPANAALFHAEPPVSRNSSDDLLKVNIIANFAPQTAGGAKLDEKDVHALVAILRQIDRDPRVGRYSLVICSLPTQKIVFQQENASRIDLPSIGAAVKSLSLGTVDAKQLAIKGGPTQFVATLISEQATRNQPDALIVVSPQTLSEAKVSKEILASLEPAGQPVFYLNYNADPWTNPWRDLIGNVVKRLRGAEYTITRPRDLFSAWSDIVTRLKKTKGNTVSSNAAVQ